MNQNTLNLVSLSRKAGLAELGEDAVGSAARAGHARLILVAEDASDHTWRRAGNFARTAACPLVRVPATKQELGWAVGRATCALAALTDPGFALRFAVSLGTLPPEDVELLEQREAKARLLRREARAHRTNLKHGKK